MGKVRRGNFVFLSWKGDYAPRHVHVYRDGKRIVKWALENGRAMEGRAGKRLEKIIRQLEAEGFL